MHIVLGDKKRIEIMRNGNYHPRSDLKVYRDFKLLISSTRYERPNAGPQKTLRGHC